MSFSNLADPCENGTIQIGMVPQRLPNFPFLVFLIVREYF